MTRQSPLRVSDICLTHYIYVFDLNNTYFFNLHHTIIDIQHISTRSNESFQFMSSFDPALRVFLIARALRIPCYGHDGDKPLLRLMNSAEVDVMVYALRRRWVPSLNAFFGDYIGDLGNEGNTLIVPLCDKKGVWGFNSAHNSSTLIRTFWRAVIEMVFDVALHASALAVGGHPLVFHSIDGNYEIEVSDALGDEWYFIVRSALVCMDDVRSLAGTPDVSELEDGLVAA